MEIIRAVHYGRVACSAQEAEPDPRLDRQLRSSSQYCSTRGWRLVAAFMHSGHGGHNGHRPMFMEMMRMALSAQPPFDVILVERADCFSRDAILLAAWHRALVRNDVHLVCTTADGEWQVIWDAYASSRFVRAWAKKKEQ